MTSPSAEEIVAQARAVEAASESGRLPLPSYVDWPSFPFEGDLRIKALVDVEVPEPPRGGVGGEDCYACKRPDDECVWTDDDWRLTSLREPSGLPAVVLLEPRDHVDFGDLPDRLIDSLGRVMWRVERALISLGNIERVQIYRVGDGAEHFHLWFLTRPRGFTQGRGSFLSHWDDILPPRPLEEWHATLAALRAALDADGQSGSSSRSSTGR